MADSAAHIDVTAFGPAAVRVIRASDEPMLSVDDQPDAIVTLRLRRVGDDGESAAGSVQLLEYRQFTDAAARNAFLRSPAPPALVEDVALEVADIVVPSGTTQLLVEPGLFVQIVDTTTAPGLVPDVLRYNTDASRTYFRPLDGFVGVVMHVGPAGAAEPNRLLELVVWRSAPDYEAATSTEHYREHVQQNVDWARTLDVARYEFV